MRSVIAVAWTALLLAACTGAPPSQPAPAPTPPPAEPTPEPEPAKPEVARVDVGADDGGEYPEVVVESDGENMAYKQTELTIQANTKTRFKMVNNATSQAMVHNIVIVKKGSEGDVGLAGMSVPKEQDHVPAHEGILAATKLAGPGETTTVVAELPAGEYVYICTFPGHYMSMQGVLKVE